jgi:ribose transport system permease protein
MTETSIAKNTTHNWRGFTQKFGLTISLFLISLTISLLSDRFLTIPNITNIIRQSTINGIISVGMTLVILTRGIDLSVGSVLGFSAVVTADVLQTGWPITLAILLGLAVGALMGLINGLLVTQVKIPPFIATLGVMTLGRGFALFYTDGKPITGLPESFRFMGNGYLGPIPMPIMIAFIVFAVAYIGLSKMKFGEYIFAIGNNEDAARLCGIPVKRYITATYAITGLLSALAGYILVGRINSAQPIAGSGFEFDAIAAVVVGGTSFEGGEGSLMGTLLGVLIIAVINNGLNLLNVPSFYQDVVKGVVIVLALLIHRLSK